MVSAPEPIERKKAKDDRGPAGVVRPPFGGVERLLDRWRQARGVESTGLRRRWHRLVAPVRRLAAGLGTRPVALIEAAPSPQNALDLFRGEWAGALPAPFDGYRAGALPLFADRRLEWGLRELGGAEGRRVLELGPMEGSHTYLLERHGARAITAVEAHPRAFLRALVLKEVLGLTRARFLLGDFVKYLETTDDRFDLGVASGVLYHMADPVALLVHLARVCDGLYLWTHYYDAHFIVRRPNVDARFEPLVARTVHGFEHAVYPYFYDAERYRPSFCGGPLTSSVWLDRDTLVAALRHVGFTQVATAFEEPDHIHGPSMALVARKPGV
jgi:hypothetical protein